MAPISWKWDWCHYKCHTSVSWCPRPTLACIMNYLAWNCQGARNSLTIQKLREYARRFNPFIIFLSWTLSYAPYISFLQSCLGYDDCFTVSCNGRKSELCFLWKYNLMVNVLVANQNLIHAYVDHVSNSTPRMFIGIYGPRQPQAKWNFWQDFNLIIPQHNLPWLLIGVFNEVLNQMEKKIGKES